MKFVESMAQWLKNIRRGRTLQVSLAADISRENESLKSTSGSRNSQAPRGLVASKPTSLLERYRIIDDGAEVEDIFQKLASKLVSTCDEISFQSQMGAGRRVILREIGSTSDRRTYVFMKPMNDYGWLIERNGAGWRISRAEKIIGQNVFMRSKQDPWDLATLWCDPKGEGFVRVRSQRFNTDLMTVNEYERRLNSSLRDLLIAGEN